MMRKVFSIIVIGLFIICDGNNAQAAEIWRYGDSTFTLDTTTLGHIRIIFYDVRVGLAQEGVSRGDVLFDGVIDGKHINGNNMLFRKDCGAMAYNVSGLYDLEAGVIFLSGDMPTRDKRCQITTKQEALIRFVKAVQ